MSQDNTAESTEGQGEVEVSATAEPQPSAPTKAHMAQLRRFANDINGLLAAKENMKIVCVDKQLRQAYYRRWLIEANGYFRLSAILRRRKSA